MALVLDTEGAGFARAPTPSFAVILLDTSAVLYLLAGHKRARRLRPHAGSLYFTPFALLEMRFLEEVGRGSFLVDSPVDAVRDDPRWVVDDPPVDGIVERALDLSWTRDPFDRLIAGHALYRGWRLATSDTAIIRGLPKATTLSL
jgi:predicted nucleic acid-binding protein